MAIRPITVDERSPERKACIAATILAGSRPRIVGTGASTFVLTGWHPEHEDAPGGGSAAPAAPTVKIVSTTGRSTLTHPSLRAGSPLSRIAGEGVERSEVGEGGRLTPA